MTSAQIFQHLSNIINNQPFLNLKTTDWRRGTKDTVLKRRLLYFLGDGPDEVEKEKQCLDEEEEEDGIEILDCFEKRSREPENA